MRHRTGAEAAAREAFKEAGLRGDVSPRSIGIYTYMKRLGPGHAVPCAVRVYPLEVRGCTDTTPRTGSAASVVLPKRPRSESTSTTSSA